MPAGADYIVAVAYTSAGLLSRKRQKWIVVGTDLVAFLGNERNQMNRMGQAAVTLVAQELLLGVRCGSKMAQ
jgi:hypothetical protein